MWGIATKQSNRKSCFLHFPNPESPIPSPAPWHIGCILLALPWRNGYFTQYLRELTLRVLPEAAGNAHFYGITGCFRPRLQKLG